MRISYKQSYRIFALITAFIVSLAFYNVSVAQSASAYQTRSGIATDYFITGPNNYFGNRPVLSSFSFDYLSSDRHFYEMTIFPEYGE